MLVKRELKNSFQKNHRLVFAKDFLYLKESSKKMVTDQIIAYYKKSRLETQETRIGISVSRKMGNSVFRNIVKRTVKESFRLSQFKNLGMDILFVFKPKEALNKLKLKEEVLEILNKIAEVKK